MKTVKQLVKTGLAVAVLVIPGLTGIAGASGSGEIGKIKDGYYGGRFAGGARAAVHIQRVVQKTSYGNEDMLYGLILRRDKKRSASLFRIEELGDGTQAWIQLVQTKDNLLSATGALDATYIARFEDRGRIRLSPTSFGEKEGCEDIVAKHSNRRIWRAIPKKGIAVDNSDGVLTQRSFHGSFSIDGVMYNGPFTLTELIPGAYVLRAQVYDAEAADGKELKKSITAIVVTVYQKKKFIFDSWMRDKYELHFIRLKPGIATCTFSDHRYEQE